MTTTKNILLGITGGIAAYKSCELVRLLKKAGHSVQVVMSHAATEFIHPNTFQALSGQPVCLQNSHSLSDGMQHIALTRGSDLFLIAPATANIIAKAAHGIADDFIATLIAARSCPLAMAPAMNQEMWHNPANLRNIQQLQNDGIHILGPDSGEQACGEVGLGRMLSPEDLADLLPALWAPKSLLGKKVMITAGATFEAIDPVRGITNSSSGLMGLSLARACRNQGANVTLIHGLLQYPIPSGLHHVEQAISAKEMYHAVHQHIAPQDIFIGVAAVADYSVAQTQEHKLKKEDTSHKLTLELSQNPDILASVAQLDPAPFCVGFAAESQNLLPLARQKRLRKNVPLLVANLVADAMGQTNNQVVLIDDTEEIPLPNMDKMALADMIVERMSLLVNTYDKKHNTPKK